MPARSTIVPPVGASVSARAMVRSGAAWEPLAVSLPPGATKTAPAGTAYDMAPGAGEPAPSATRELVVTVVSPAVAAPTGAA